MDKHDKSQNEILIEVRNLKKYFTINHGFFAKSKKYVKAVDDVSFYIKKVKL